MPPPIPKPVKAERKRKPMNKIGKVGRAKLDIVAELTEQAMREGWIDRCEVCPVLFEHKLVDTLACPYGPLTFAHSWKHRGGDYKLDREVARCCEPRHFYVLDLLPPKLTHQIVLEAIARRVT